MSKSKERIYTNNLYHLKIMMRVCCLLAMIILGSNVDSKNWNSNNGWIKMYHGPTSNGGLYQIGCNATIPRRPTDSTTTTPRTVSVIEFYFTPVGGKKRRHTLVDLKEGIKDYGANLILYSYWGQYAILLWSSEHYRSGKLDGEWLCIVYGMYELTPQLFSQKWYSCGRTKLEACDWSYLVFQSLVGNNNNKKKFLQSKCPVIHVYDPDCGKNCGKKGDDCTYFP